MISNFPCIILISMLNMSAAADIAFFINSILLPDLTILSNNDSKFFRINLGIIFYIYMLRHSMSLLIIIKDQNAPAC